MSARNFQSGHLNKGTFIDGSEDPRVSAIVNRTRRQTDYHDKPALQYHKKNKIRTKVLDEEERSRREVRWGEMRWKENFASLACFGRWCFGGPPSISCGVTLHRCQLADQALMVDCNTSTWLPSFAVTDAELLSFAVLNAELSSIANFYDLSEFAIVLDFEVRSTKYMIPLLWKKRRGARC